MSTSVFQNLTDAEQIFKDLIFMPMIMAGEIWLESSLPALALPVIKQIDEAFIMAFADALFQQIVMLIDITAIKLINGELQTAWDTASFKLRVIAQEHGIKSPEYIAARENAKIEFSKFTNISHT